MGFHSVCVQYFDPKIVAISNIANIMEYWACITLKYIHSTHIKAHNILFMQNINALLKTND